jgi:hypothetical protein
MNAKMKVLSLALIASFGYVGAAAAACPAGPDQANGGAWTAVSQFQGTAVIATPGYAGTECRLDSSINAGASGAASAVVQDDTPAAESRYRASFIVNLDSLAAPTIITGANIFSAVSDATGGGVNLGVFGNGGQWFVSYIVADANEPSGFYAGSAPLTAGINHVEFDLQIGASGSFALWVNSNVEGSPTLPAHTVNNATAVGIDNAYLGLAAPSSGFVAAYAGMAAGFDQFDSRRQTFIGY